MCFLGVTGRAAAEFAGFKLDDIRFRDGVRVVSESANAGRPPASGLGGKGEDMADANFNGGGGSRFDL